MKVYLDCFPCFVRQTLEAARMVSDDEREHRALLDLVMQRLLQLPLDITPPQVGQIVHGLIREHFTDDDPYRQLKDRYNRLAMGMLAELRVRMRRAPDPLLTACKLAVAGNVIDFGALSGEFAIDDYPRFRATLEGATRVLYLGDNCGEIVFDRLLVEMIRRDTDAKVCFAVRGGPVLNDAAVEEPPCGWAGG